MWSRLGCHLVIKMTEVLNRHLNIKLLGGTMVHSVIYNMIDVLEVDNNYKGWIIYPCDCCQEPLLDVDICMRDFSPNKITLPEVQGNQP